MEALVFWAVYGLYHLSLYASVPGGDSGELLAEACVSASKTKIWLRT